MKKVLGIDCSSSCIGYCVLEFDEISNEIYFKSVDFLKPIKEGNLIDRIANTRDKVKKIIEEIKPDYIAIEDIISFMKGASTAKTIIMLTTFNRMVCLIAHDYLQRPPELFNVMSIRHGIKKNKILPKKEEIPQLVSEHLKIKFPYRYNKKQKLIIENYDMGDGIAVALFYAFKLTGKIKKK